MRSSFTLGLALALSPFLIGPRAPVARALPLVDPAPGPGAVIAMHRELFAAMDRGDVAASLAFLHPDMGTKESGRERPCTLWLVGEDGSPLKADSYEESKALLALVLKNDAAENGEWKTTITSAHDDCFSRELTWCTLEFERSHVVSGKTTTRRFRSTTLATYDGRWQMTHWHVSSADAAPKTVQAGGR